MHRAKYFSMDAHLYYCILLKALNFVVTSRKNTLVAFQRLINFDCVFKAILQVEIEFKLELDVSVAEVGYWEGGGIRYDAVEGSHC